MSDRPPLDESLSRFQRFLARVTGPAIRAVRTFAQTTIGVYLAGIVAAPAVSDLANLTLIDSAIAAGFVATLSLVQNLLEDSRSVGYDRG